MTPPVLRWSFSLRTMFVVVTLLAIPMAWVACQLNWIRERNDFLAADLAIPSRPPYPAPWSLRLLGERGQQSILVRDCRNYEEARRLFPESLVFYDFSLK